jgi:twitching motility protein PilJ
MQSNTDNLSKFKRIALFAALLLIGAAALVYWQAGDDSATAPKLTALSQSIPALAASALAGENGSFEELESSVARVQQLRRGGSAPGAGADWDRLESLAANIVAGKTDVTAFHNAVKSIGTDATAMVEQTNALLDSSGSTATLQVFQQRADQIRQAAMTLPGAGQTVATAMSEDADFLGSVLAALGGEPTDRDVKALAEGDREAVLAPLVASLSSLNEQLTVVSGTIEVVDTLGAAQASLGATGDKLLGAALASGTGDSQTKLPAFLRFFWIPLALIFGALLLLITLFGVHAKSAIFERSAGEHAAQNERNQQAILRLLDEMGGLADGDLTVEATVSEDITGTIADSFNFAIEELRKLVATVNHTAILVDSATKQTAGTAVHLAKAAKNQTTEINAATQSIVSMAASIEEVSGNAERSSDVARHSVEVAHKGGEAVRRTIDGMNAIRETIQETSKRIKRLGESSQEIGNIVELINDIAEQTNILALNASIQASMAGEAGRGFAVVADEVQRLAERSTNATKQIEVLVRTIQADTNEAVVSMERSTTDVVGGALLAENAGAALDEIEQVSNQIASLVQNILSSARQQAGSAADVTRRTTRLREIGIETGQATAATAASIAKLSQLATQLRKTVEGFALPADMMPAATLASTTTSSIAQSRTPQVAPPGDQVKAG